MLKSIWLFCALVLLASLATSCGEAVSDNRARNALTDAGYSDVLITAQHGIAPGLYGCGHDDAVAFEAVATNPAGRRVGAVVCCGLVLKGCTVRH